MSTTLRYGASAIKNAKAPEVGQLDYKIEGRPGLRLRVAASGLKTWTHLYRHEGRLHRGLIGSYPSKSLAEADRLWSDARDALRTGINPYPSRAEREAEAQRKKTEAAKAAADTFRAAAGEYFADKGKGGGGSPKSRRVIERPLELRETLVDGRVNTPMIWTRCLNSGAAPYVGRTRLGVQWPRCEARAGGRRLFFESHQRFDQYWHVLPRQYLPEPKNINVKTPWLSRPLLQNINVETEGIPK